ncbi:hypothetical protein GOBAR_AA13726 [Gossypium barbadense]|uniref:DUF4283 domain-containing protein n=1 Tax=Gossypium barbadense TaxID=3634 RepID=A0A2P5XUA0_GOSBA|nr:hypothetical protein GOBAR_AA13726 [Gossypium barbadense]
MEAALADLRLEDEEGNGEGEGREIDLGEGLVEDIFNFCLVGANPLKVPLFKLTFWVQIHNLPNDMYMEAMAKQFGRLGHGESFCLIQIVKGSQELPRGWNISLRAMARKMVAGGSIWLHETEDNWGGNSGVTMEEKGKFNLNINVANFMRNAGSNMSINLVGKSKLPCIDEDIFEAMNANMGSDNRPINFVDGKKRPRYFDDGCGSDENVEFGESKKKRVMERIFQRLNL